MSIVSRGRAAFQERVLPDGRQNAFLRLIWLVYLLYPLSHIPDRVPSAAGRVTGITLIVVFAIVYAALLPRAVRLRLTGTPEPYSWSLVMLFAIAAAIVPFAGESSVALLPFLAAYSYGLYPGRRSGVLIAATIALAFALPYAIPSWDGDGINQGISQCVVVLLIVTFIRLARTVHELEYARGEVARLAIADERLRFARDVHDVLGHGLTVISLKAQLARRLVDVDPEKAKAELAELEALSRQALLDVRATAAGYREVTLAGELATAVAVLRAAGIDAQIDEDATAPADVDALFGWTVREAVTNVVRHSRATHCRIVVDGRTVEISDDGRGLAPTDGGNGLRGLRERAETCGATVDAGPVPGGGFRVRVSAPLPGAALGTAVGG